MFQGNGLAVLVVAFVMLVSGGKALADASARTAPNPAGPHSCSNYPPEPFRNFVQGETEVQFKISIEGTPTDVAVRKTSGNAELDQAAVACVSGWRYSPATEGGKAIETDWNANVVWKIDVVLPWPTPNSPHTCVDVVPRPTTSGSASLSFNVGTDGRVNTVSVFKSSGAPDLDAALVACVLKWTYAPASKNGTPVAVQWGTKFEWSDRGEISATDGYARPHYCGPRWYPSYERQHGIQGTTLLAFFILDDGSISQIAIRESSGDEGLDKAAVGCAQGWKYKPAIQGGKPVTIPWAAQVTWANGQAFVVELPDPDSSLKAAFNSANAPELAKQYDTPPKRLNPFFCGPSEEELRAREQGKVVTKFRILKDGTVSNVTIVQSSGYDDLDHTASACVSRFRYAPALLGGQPVDVDWEVAQEFKIIR